MKNLVYILLIAFVSINIYAQERCGTDLLWEFESQQNPEIVQKRVLMEEAISNYVKKRNTVKEKGNKAKHAPKIVATMYNHK